MANNSSNRKPATPFQRFVTRTYEWELAGYSFFELRADGTARSLVAGLEKSMVTGVEVMVPVWHLLEFNVDKADIDKFAALIDNSGFRDLDASYEANIDDGTLEELLLEDMDSVKRVQCSNRFPDAVITLKTFIQETILAKQPASIADKAGLSHDQAETIWESVLETKNQPRQPRSTNAAKKTITGNNL